MAATITTAEVAEAIGTTPRELRKFLRSDEGPGKVGKGARYALPADARSLKSLAKKFAKWDEARKTAETPDESTED